MSKGKNIASLVFLAIVAFVLINAIYTVNEVQQIIVTQFGKPIGEPVTTAGLKMKIPFIQEVNPIDKRVLEWDGAPSDMPTKDKLYISVDLFARWRIVDPLQYFLRLRDERSAQSRLDDILGSETRNAVAKHELIEIIRTTKDRVPLRDSMMTSAQQEVKMRSLVPIQKGRKLVENEIFTAAAEKVQVFGIELLDIRFKRINYNQSVRPKTPQGFGQYFYERFAWQNLEDWLNLSLYPNYRAHRFAFVAYDMPRDVPYASALPADMTLSVKKTAIDVTAVMTGVLPGPGQPQQVAIRITLPATMPVVDLTVDWEKQPDSWPEAGWICLPFKIDNPKFRLGRLGADLDPVKDLTVDESNFYNSWINTGVAVYDGNTGAGVGVCPIDSPLVSLGETGGYKFATRYEPKKPYVYLNLYNNHWRTNFAAWIGDGRRMSSRVRLWTFDKFASESALFTPAMEARVPLAVARSVCHPGKLPPTQAGIELSRKGVLVTAFGPNPDGPGTVLRVWEQGGNSGPLHVQLPDGCQVTKASPVNLRGTTTGNPLAVTDGAFTIDLAAYAPASFVLDVPTEEKTP